LQYRAFALCGPTVAGVFGASFFAPTAVAGSLASGALVVIFFQPWLVAGLAIDPALIWLAVFAGWSPDGLGT